MSLVDLDELTLSCRNTDARSYVSEAVACYKAGAFRACIVATWIAVVYDLLAKIRELALGGDAEARHITEDVQHLQPLIDRGDQGAIRHILEIERDIIATANDKFAFFDGQQVVDLTRLRDDRNRCAHPSYQGIDQPYLPSAELARTHLVHAVRHVLAAEPVQGKAATGRVVQIVRSTFFPREVAAAKVHLRSVGLDRPKESLIRSVTDELIYGAFEGDDALKAQRRTAVALRAVYELFPGPAESRVRRALNIIGRRAPDNDIFLFFGFQAHFPLTWSFLEEDNRNRLISCVTQSEVSDVIELLPVCLTVPELLDIALVRIRGLDYGPLGELLEKSKHPAAVTRAIDLFCSAKNWNDANAIYNVIKPILGEFNEPQVRRILMAPRIEGADLYQFSEGLTLGGIPKSAGR